jgi:hypothetical protein
MENAKPPDHLDRRARTERLYDHLLNDGLWVEPVYAEDGEMEYLKVAVMPPR